jgi:hypothetical protein
MTGGTEMIEWYEAQDLEELLTEFLDKQKILDKWEEFLNDRWISDEADAADARFDAMKDDEMIRDIEEKGL